MNIYEVGYKNWRSWSNLIHSSSKKDVIDNVETKSPKRVQREIRRSSLTKPPHLLIAEDALRRNVTEIRGRRHSKEVLSYYRDVGQAGIKRDEVAWCAAFVGSCLKRGGARYVRGKDALLAQAYKDYNVPSKKSTEGDICVFWRGSRNSWKGHVGFYYGETKKHIKVLGGNQSNRVSLALYPKYRLISIRKPKYA